MVRFCKRGEAGGSAMVNSFGQRLLLLASDGTVYIADTNNNRIQRFTSDGAFLAKWGFSGSGDGIFSTPSDVATGPDGSVYVADSGNHRIQRFTPEGAYVTKWGSEGSGDGQFFYPQAIVVGLDGSVYVGNNDRIQKFTADGVFVFSGGSSGTGTGQFLEIASVAVAPDGTIYTVDIENDDVQRFDSNLGLSLTGVAMEIRMAGFTTLHMSHPQLTVLYTYRMPITTVSRSSTGMEILSPLGGLKDQVMVTSLPRLV